MPRPVAGKPVGEFDLIARYFVRLSGPEGLGLIDDAALLTAGSDLVVTKDLLIEDVHFFPDDPVDSIGHRALAVNLSDLAAKGARPFCYFLGLGLPKPIDPVWLDGFTDALSTFQQRFSIRLAGGDTTASPGPYMVSVTAIGYAPEAGMIRRSGAREDDIVMVTGDLGAAALGLAIRRGTVEGDPILVQRYRYPEPRISAGQGLAGLASAAADISDGLLADLGHICTASGVGAVIDAGSLPVCSAARTLIDRWPEGRACIWSGGDDYELVFTVPPAAFDAVMRLSDRLGLPFHRIGRIVQGSGVALVDRAGRPVQTGGRGYDHFASDMVAGKGGSDDG